MYRQSEKKLVKQQYVLHMFPQYGELRRTSGWDRFTSLGYPCKFQLVSRLGSITARHLVVDVSQTLRRWTEGATYIRQGDHHVGHWPTFLVFSFFSHFQLCILLYLLLLPFVVNKSLSKYRPLCRVVVTRNVCSRSFWSSLSLAPHYSNIVLCYYISRAA